METNVHIEVLRQEKSTLPEGELKALVIQELKNAGGIVPSSIIKFFKNETLKNHVEEIRVCEVFNSNIENEEIWGQSPRPLEDVNVQIYIYRLNSDDMQAELITMEDGTEVTCAANHCLLPNLEFHMLWESLVYDTTVKHQLLKCAETTMLFSQKGVNPTIINWNKVVLLHGPPGSGKTSLCKALAQKLSIRLSHMYRYAEFMEINSHSLFSKYFSESGKLVTEMFNKIKEQLAFKESFVCVLIDEVESLARARDAVLAGTEPSDAIRVVNALLTQIDIMKRYPNVLILTTSNLSNSIDLAFVDRADLKIYIGPPEVSAIYKIYSSCLEELIRVKVIDCQEKSKPHWHTYTDAIKMLDGKTEDEISECLRNSKHLLEVSKSSVGLSGRTLRKVPFLTHVKFIGSHIVTIEQFLNAMLKTVEECKEEINCFVKKESC